jgi:hypothetical protein
MNLGRAAGQGSRDDTAVRTKHREFEVRFSATRPSDFAIFCIFSFLYMPAMRSSCPKFGCSIVLDDYLHLRSTGKVTREL